MDIICFNDFCIFLWPEHDSSDDTIGNLSSHQIIYRTTMSQSLSHDSTLNNHKIKLTLSRIHTKSCRRRVELHRYTNIIEARHDYFFANRCIFKEDPKRKFYTQLID